MANGKKYHEIGLDNRTRDDDGEIRQKRGDTLVRTLRQEYGPNCAQRYAARHPARARRR